MINNKKTKVQPQDGCSLDGGCDESAIIDKSKDSKESLQVVEAENSVPTESKKSWVELCVPHALSGFFNGLTRFILEYVTKSG